MTFEIIYVLGLLVGVIVVFSTERVPVDMVVLCLLVALIVGRILTVEEAFAGYGKDVIIMLASVFVISGALKETGMLDTLGSTLLQAVGKQHHLLLPMLMIVVALMSAFMNNTTVTAMFVGPVLGMCKHAKISPSKLLMPLAFASILGGTATLIGTSTNLAVSGYLAKHAAMAPVDPSLDAAALATRAEQLSPIGLFEFSAVGLLLCFVGIAYMVFFGKKSLPDRPMEDATDEFSIRSYLAEIVVLENSPLHNQTVGDSDLGILGFNVLKIVRDGAELAPVPDRRIFSNDIVLVAGNVQTLMKVKKIEGIEIKADMQFREEDLQSSKGRNIKAAEMLVTERSPVVGRTLREGDFRRHYGLTVLAIFRGGKSLSESVGEVVIRAGDLLLVQGPAERFDSLDEGNDDLVLLSDFDGPRQRKGTGFAVLGAFGIAIVAGSFEKQIGIPVSICVLAAAIFSVLIGAIKAERCYRSIDWRSLILIGGMTAFGGAMAKSGTADWLASIVTTLLGDYGPHAVLVGFCLLTVLISQPMSNAAAAMVVLPIALVAAEQMGLNLRCFAIAIMMSASISLMTPFEPSCLLVLGPGKYRLMDFIRVGGVLSLFLVLVIVLVVPLIWPIR